MTFNFYCAKCGKRLEVADDLIGQTLPCGGCGFILSVPDLREKSACPAAGAPARRRTKRHAVPTGEKDSAQGYVRLVSLGASNFTAARHRLTLKRKELCANFKPLMKLTRTKLVTLSYIDGNLVAEAAWVSYMAEAAWVSCSVPASGQWSGVVSVRGSAGFLRILRHLLKLPNEEVVIAAEERCLSVGGRLLCCSIKNAAPSGRGTT